MPNFSPSLSHTHTHPHTPSLSHTHAQTWAQMTCAHLKTLKQSHEVGCEDDTRTYFSHSVFKVFWQKSIPAQIHQRILYNSNSKE